MESAPPEYRANGNGNGRLPSYRRSHYSDTSRRLLDTEHSYHLSNGKSNWATLKLQSAARTSQALPLYLEGDAITGSVELNGLEKEQITEISLVVVGRLVTCVEDYDYGIFLSVSETVWSRSMGDPRRHIPSATPSPYNEKLNGDYSWPFAVKLPRSVKVPSKATPKGVLDTIALPATFLEKRSRASIQYDIHLEVKRGRFRSDSKIGTVFQYLPHIKPCPASPSRQLAYQEGRPIPGPSQDPENWETLKPFYIHGTIFNDRAVHAKCTVSLAKPLCYTRGSIIPCAMHIETADDQALDLLSSPRAPVVRLQRDVAYNTESTAIQNCKPESNSEVSFESTAVWWSSSEVGEIDGDGHRRLYGEIQLSKHLQPSSAVLHYSLSYHVVVLPFEAIAFNSANKGTLSTRKVEIATIHADGPRPKNYASPASSDTASSTGSRMSQFTVGTQGTWS